MSVILYPHNQTTYAQMVKMFETSNRVGIVQPTGTGKSFLFLKWIEDNPNDQFVVLSPSTEIFTQLHEYAEVSGCPQLLERVRLISYQELLRKTDDEVTEIQVDKIILDEFHRTGAEQWGPSLLRLLDANPKAKVLGASATPVRYLDDSRDMASELFDNNLAVEMTLGEAVRRKILPEPVYIPVWYDITGKMAQYEEDISKISKADERKEMENLLERLKRQLEKSYGAAEIFQKHMPHDYGKYIVFCSNREHLEEMKNKIPRWISGINKNIRSYISISALEDKDIQLQAFKDNNEADAIKLLFTIDRLNEGVHVKGVDGVIMLRPTVSPIIYLQQMGRALAAGGDKPLIFDMVNNYANVHGALNDGESRNIFEIEYISGGTAEDIGAFQIFEDMVRFNTMLEELEDVLYPSNDLRWEQNLNLCIAYRKEFGIWPAVSTTYQGKKIGPWLRVQKTTHRKGLLSEERVQKLIAAGVPLEYQKQKSDEDYMIGLCIKYKEEFGSWPSQQTIYKEKKIGHWLTYQKVQYRKGLLSKERVQKLIAAGISMEHQAQQNDWDHMLRLCIKYKEEFGTWPTRRTIFKEKKIGLWLADQKFQCRKGLLSEERVQKLIAAGINLDYQRQINDWDNMLELCIKHKEEFGTWPSQQTIYKEKKIGRWLATQKSQYRKGLLSKERVQKLIAAGISMECQVQQNDWDNMLELCIKHKEEFDVWPTQKTIFEEKRIGRWLADQKYQYRKGLLSEERVQKLIAAGIELKKQEG